MIPLGNEFGPEHIAVGPDGRLYAAMTSGALVRFDADGGNPQAVANTGGRVLGIGFDAAGRMVVADAMRGLLEVGAEGDVTVLADHVSPADPIRYANALDIGPDGTVYLTDSSTRFSPRDWGDTYRASVLDIMEQSATGRVLAYDPRTKTTHVVARGISFANGVALSADGRSLFVSETGRYRVWKIDADARDVDVASGSGQASVLIDNLPGYPDNLTRGEGGRLWLGLFRPRNPAADSLAPYPFLRKVLLRLPRSMLPLGKPYGHVVAFDELGRIVADLQDPTGAYPETTGATEVAGRLYIHSLYAPTMGWLPL
jgi:sugar lactone lactonase YvrE